MELTETVYENVISIKYPTTCLLYRIILTNKAVWSK